MLIGHERIWNFLMQSASKDRLAHAYLFSGPSEVGKKTLVLEFIRWLLCEKKGKTACGQCLNCQKISQNQHPDVLLVDPFAVANAPENANSDESKEAIKVSEIKIETVRQVQHQLSLSPFSAKRKVVILDSADRLTQEAANCLLKTLEEPPQKSLLFLISSGSQRILPTIISRCQILKFFPVPGQVLADELRNLGLAGQANISRSVRLSCGRPGIAIRLLKDKALFDEKKKRVDDLKALAAGDMVKRFKYAQVLAQNSYVARDVLADWTIWLRDKMLNNVGVSSLAVFDDEPAARQEAGRICGLIKSVQATRDLLGDSSFNSRLILENLMLKL